MAETNGFVTEKHCLDKHSNMKWSLGIIASIMMSIILTALGYAVGSVIGTNEDIKELRDENRHVQIEQAVLEKTCETMISDIREVKELVRELSRRNRGDDK